MAAVGRAEAGSGPNQEVGVCDAAAGGAGCENGESEIVGAESWDGEVVVAAGGAGRDGACEMEWISQCQVRRGRSEVQRLSVAANGGGMCAVSAAVPAVDGARCCFHSFPRYLLHRVCLQQQIHPQWKSEKGNAPTCPEERLLSFV